MTEDREDQAPPTAPQATQRRMPPPPAYQQQPGVYPPDTGQPPAYPPPPEYYQRPLPPPVPTAPGYAPNGPSYAPYQRQFPNYPPYGPEYGQSYPPGYASEYPPDYAEQLQRQPAAPTAEEADTGVHVFWPIVSALASFGIYALLLGWQFGLGFMGLLLVHEMGHFVVIRAKGMPAGLPIFIPLLGAFVTMRRNPATVRDEAEIALAGPLAGTVGGVACLIAYWQTGIPVLLPLAYFSFYINLLNLIPVGPLDGARIVAAISKWIWPIGLAGVALGAWYTHDVLLIILGIFGIFQLVTRFGEAGKSTYYSISTGARIYITLLYFGLAAVLAYASFTLQPLMAARGGPF